MDDQEPINRGVRSDLKPGSPAAFLLVSAFAILVWIFWASTGWFWAKWAGAIPLDATAAKDITSSAGAWGDSFGGFNALVGALGFAAIATTLHLQYKSIEKQNIDQHILRFEETFFRLIDLMIRLRLDIRYKHTTKYLSIKNSVGNTKLYQEHEAIEAAYREITTWSFKASNGKRIRKKVVSAQYDNYVHNRFEWCFAPYYRIIYTMLHLIYNDKYLNDTQKAYYGNILRSQFTSFEIGLLAFNATSTVSKDLAFYVAEFRLLKYLPKKRRKVLGNIFPESAFSSRDNN